MGLELCRALDESVSLTEVDVGSNELGDSFGEALAKVLRTNEVLWKIDVTRNLLGVRSGQALLEAVSKKNSTVVSIGDTADALFGLGLQTRYQLQCHLDANRRVMTPGHRPEEESMHPELKGVEFTILDDEPDVPA